MEEYYFTQELPFSKIKKALLTEFIDFSYDNLDLWGSKPVELFFALTRDQDPNLHSAGYVTGDGSKISIYIEKRAFADVLRTLAHEFVHKQQDENGTLNKMESGDEALQEIEDEANAIAGRLVRAFGEMHSEIYDENLLEHNKFKERKTPS